MKILVCGGRDFNDYKLMDKVLCLIWLPHYVLIHGCAKGADTLAEEWMKRQYPVFWTDVVMRFPPDWKRWGLQAGPIRNQQMIDEGKPDFGVAFRGGKGTADMVLRLKIARVPCLMVN